MISQYLFDLNFVIRKLIKIKGFKMERYKSTQLNISGMPAFKVILLGGGRVGKTSLVQQLLIGEFNSH